MSISRTFSRIDGIARLLQKSLLLCVATLCILTSIAQGQGEGQGSHEQLLQEFSATDVEFQSESVWKFGVRVTANGNARGITATCPIPIDWDDQTVVEISQDKTDNVNRVSFKKLTAEVNQMVVRINQLPDGAVAEATVTVRIQKTPTEAPEDPASLNIPRKVPSKIRKYLAASPYIESTNRQVRDAAEAIEFAEGITDWEKIETIYLWVRENIEYRFDTEIHTCMDALESGHGDCEELSSLFIAICRINDIPARAVWVPGHTYPEFYMEDKDGTGFWIPCQAAGTRSFGAMSEPRPVLQRGDKFRMPGASEHTRYVIPTLVAKDVEGAPTLEWISEELPSEDSDSSSDATDR